METFVYFEAKYYLRVKKFSFHLTSYTIFRISVLYSEN